DRPCRVHKEFGWAGDVLAVLSAPGVQHTVLTNDIRLRIRKEFEGIALSLAELSRRIGGINADRGDGNAPLAKFAQVLLKTPQLAGAEDSPIAAIEDQEDRKKVLQEVDKDYLLRIRIRERDDRRQLSSAERA